MIGGYAHCNIFTAVACHLAVFYVTHRWVRGGAVVLLSTGLEDRDTFENINIESVDFYRKMYKLVGPSLSGRGQHYLKKRKVVQRH